jgi:hypothetical protein
LQDGDKLAYANPTWAHSEWDAPTTHPSAASVGPTQPPSRYVLHTDAEDPDPSPYDGGFVELPPQYFERQGPGGNNPVPHNYDTKHPS